MSKKQVVPITRKHSIVNKQKKETIFERFKKDLGEDYACFVLITCTQPSVEGKMEVEMDYEGDETLAAFLIENAGQVFEGQNAPTHRKYSQK